MINTVLELIKTARPVHWVKNFGIYAALIFSGTLFESNYFLVTTYAFLIFSMATSAIYTLNDVFDYQLDKIHPIKKKRPIARDAINIPTAISFSLSLSIVSAYLAYKLNFIFYLLVVSYLVLQVLYSVYLKNLAIVDILVIASGFIIRVYSGAFVIDVHLSVWFLLCVVSVALFLASGKRRAELNVIEKTKELTRKSLNKYPKELLNSYVTMFGNAAWMSWALFTFFESPSISPSVWLLLAELSRTTTINKLLMITTPLVIFIIMRYESLIFEGKSESPEKLFLTDKNLVISILTWLALVMWIFYGGISLVV